MKTFRHTSSAKILSSLILPSVVLFAAPCTAEPVTPKTSIASPVGQHDQETVYATVNGKPILIRDYVNTFNSSLRQKFYHGKVPEGEMSKVREDVLDQMIMRILLLEEANRRGLTADENKIAEAIAGYDKQYASSPSWQENREQLLPGLRTRLAEQDLLEQIEKTSRAVPEVTDADARRFYDNHRELFTEPEKLKMSVILLGVDPSSPKERWDDAMEEARKIHKRLLEGADFAETARTHSSGAEASQGGALGYIHRGMLPEVLEKKIDEFKIGEIPEPLMILEGVAIFRLEDRLPAKLREFTDVVERARSLARREREDAAWSKLKANLKSAAKIKLLVNPAQSSDSRP